MKQRIAEIIRGHKYEHGPPLAERAVLIAQAEERIHTIEERHTELVDLAGTLSPPIEIALLPEVRARRETERARLIEEKAVLERRRETEAQVNRSPVARAARVGRSSYLENNRGGPFNS